MSSVSFGTDTSFESIAPFREYVSISNDEVEFMSGLKNPVYGHDQSYIYAESDADTKDYRLINSTMSHMYKNKYELLKLISYFKLENLFPIYGDYTVFLPLDLTNMKLEIKRAFFSPKEVLKYHILPFVILPEQLKHKKLKLRTSLEGHFIFTDNFSIIGQDTTTNITKKELINRIKIVDIIKTTNGMMYIIDRSLTPYNW